MTNPTARSRPSLVAAAVLGAAAVLLAAAPVWAQAPPSAPPSVQGAAQAAPPPAPPEDVLARARRLATSGQRPQAAQILEDRLRDRPGDVDALTLLGAIHSWEGRLADARAELRKVLQISPGYYDAMAALANVELWDGHPDMAWSLASSVLRRNPSDAGALLTRARAESALGRVNEARVTLDRLLAADPANTQVRTIRDRLDEKDRYWSVGYGVTADWFSDARSRWLEYTVTAKRAAGFGSGSLTVWQADRYGLRDRQIELELYPRLRSGTYLYIDAGVGQDHTLYPKYRAGLHLYQSLGGGFEASLGMSRLGFGSGINIYIASLSKYLGSWLLISQVFVTPHDFGTNASYHLAIRRYLTDKNYIGIRYHYGAARENIRTINDVLPLNANGVSAEAVLLFGSRVGLTLRGAYDHQQRFNLSPLKQYSAGTTMYVRF